MTLLTEIEWLGCELRNFWLGLKKKIWWKINKEIGMRRNISPGWMKYYLRWQTFCLDDKKLKQEDKR